MSVVFTLLDRVRLRGAPVQVQEAQRLYRGLKLGGMVLGNLTHAYPDYQAVRQLLREMRGTDPADTARLDELLSAVRRHASEWEHVQRLERRIPPSSEPDEPPQRQTPAQNG